MTKIRHRAPAARRAELVAIINRGLPCADLTPQNRWQRRQIDRALRRAKRQK